MIELVKLNIKNLIVEFFFLSFLFIWPKLLKLLNEFFLNFSF